MKSTCLLGVACLLTFAGCGDKSNSGAVGGTNAASSGNPVDAPADYMRAAAKGQQDAVKTVGTSSVKAAIDAFSADKGRYPKDLDELVSAKYLPKIPDSPYGMKMTYDANNGTVNVVKQ
jgi:hypothetical protein